MNTRQHNNSNRVIMALALLVAVFAGATSQPAKAQLPDVSQFYTIQTVERPKGATDIQFFEVSETGLVAVQYTAGGRTHSALLEKGAWTVIDAPGSTWCGCTNPSTSGKVGLTFARSDGVNHSVIYDGGTYQYLPDHPVYILQYMSYDGLRMSGAAWSKAEPTGTMHGLMLNASLSLFQVFDFPGAKSTLPMGINDAGVIVGSYQVGGFNVGPAQGFLYDGKDLTEIRAPGAGQTFPMSIDNGGDIVGGYEPNDSPGAQRGFILHQGEWKGFAVPGCSTDILCFINNRGQLAGICTDQKGKHGFIATPRVDFNHDGKVDIKDLRTLIDHWGQNYPPCDIGPLPWGDGKVDANDLEVLMGYWGQEMDLLNPTLTAFWRLDEADGIVAQDTQGRNDGTLTGHSVWQPTGGRVKGALQLDGVDSYVSTPFIVNPVDGAFSVFAWVKGGGSGQVILSQEQGANWLMVGAGGVLMTTLRGSGRGAAGSLTSSTVISDGLWHQVGLAWDGDRRTLYIDGLEAARDTQPQRDLAPSTGGLHLGADSTCASNAFWSGLIDHVRVYNSVVKP